MGYLLKELKRRNVFRVGAAYVVVSWLIIQVIETVSGPLGLPEWTEAFFIVLLLAGLPVVLIFAWAFEMTPEGLKKTREVDRTESVTADTGRKLNHAIIVVLVVALGYFVWERQGLVQRVEPTANGETTDAEVVQTAGVASVAVLPFVNMSADPEQEYFSDGISEELLNLLAKIPELRVPARTSSFQFKGQNLDISEVAKELNVAHVLEGSVRRADVRIRVTAQLIEAETGYHLWSETYDRELDDIFRIQDEISAAIVRSLSETLGIDTGEAPQVRAAANPEAYNSYLLGQHLIQKRTKQDIESAIPNYERAIELDPAYAPAHAGLGLAWYLLTASRPTYGDLTLEESLRRAMPHIEKALSLDPELAEAHGAMGLVLDAQEQYEEAITHFETALNLNASLTDVRNWYSAALESLGRRDESLEQIQKAYDLDPLSVLTLNNFTNDLIIRRQFDRAGPVIDRLEQVDPARGGSFRSFVIAAQGRAADGAVQMFRTVDIEPGNLRIKGQATFVLIGFGLYDEALQVWPYPNILPVVSAGPDREYTLELALERFQDDPNNPEALENLAWAYWNVDDREQALKLASRYRESLGEARRSIDGINRIFVTDAWQREDQEALRQFLDPLEANIENALSSGIDMPFTHLGKAWVLTIKGDVERAYEHFDRALSIGTVSPDTLDTAFETMGWGDIQEFVERRKAYETYLYDERRKFLSVACGPDGFVAWQPSPDTCAEVDSI